MDASYVQVEVGVVEKILGVNALKEDIDLKMNQESTKLHVTVKTFINIFSQKTNWSCVFFHILSWFRRFLSYHALSEQYEA